MTINETEVINNVNASARLLSTKTQLDMHPYVSDVEAELDAKKKEQATLTPYGSIESGTTPAGDETIEDEDNIDDVDGGGNKGGGQ